MLALEIKTNLALTSQNFFLLFPTSNFSHCFEGLDSVIFSKLVQ
jgi:hypothetical protein